MLAGWCHYHSAQVEREDFVFIQTLSSNSLGNKKTDSCFASHRCTSLSVASPPAHVNFLQEYE